MKSLMDASMWGVLTFLFRFFMLVVIFDVAVFMLLLAGYCYYEVRSERRPPR